MPYHGDHVCAADIEAWHHGDPSPTAAFAIEDPCPHTDVTPRDECPPSPHWPAAMNPPEQARCRCCGQSSSAVFEGELLRRHIRYYECPHCAYLQTQDPDWLDEAYAHALNLTDTGLVRRGARNTRRVIALMSVMGCLHQPMLDFAGGSGLLVRMLRDRGIDARWNDAHADNVFARGFEHHGEPVAMVTAFEVFEHLVDPAETLSRLAAWADAVFISTEIAPVPAPRPQDWGYYGREHGQHIGFFRLRTLQWLAAGAGWHLRSDGQTYHLFTRKPVSAWRWYIVHRWARLASALAGLRLKSLIGRDQQALLHRS